MTHYKIRLDAFDGVCSWDEHTIGEADGNHHYEAIQNFINSTVPENKRRFIGYSEHYKSYGEEFTAGFCKIFAVEWSHEHDMMAKEAAYYKWLHAGCPTDRSHQFWVAAENDIIKTLPKLY